MRSSRFRVVIVLLLVLAMTALAFALTAAPARADHGSVDWNYSVPVTTDANVQTFWPWVLDDQAGNLYVSYNYYNTATTTTNVYITKFHDSQLGAPPAKVLESQVNTIANVVSNTYGTAMTMDPAGNLYVAWNRNDPTFGLEVYVSKSANGGSTWSTEVRANAPNAYGNDYWPKIASTGDGTIYVGWRQDWGTASVSVSKSVDHGATFGSWNNASVQTSTFIPTRFDLAADAHGRVYLAVEAYSATFGHNEIYLLYSDDGVTWSSPALLSVGVAGGIGPTLRVDSAGRVYVAWLGIVASSYHAYLSYSDDRGATWSPAFPVSQGVSTVTRIPSLAVQYDTAMVVWGASSGSTPGIGYVVSADRGATWYPEAFYAPSVGPGYTLVGADQNGTFYSAYETSGSMVYVSTWHSPPSMPVITGVAAGTASLTVTWAANPEPDVVGYEVFRSTDGSTYNTVANVPASQTSFTDSGLANGTYFYEVVAVDNVGAVSHDSAAASGVVGTTTAQLIASLQSQIAALKTQIAALQNSQAASNAATAAQLAQLQGNLTKLQQQLSGLQNAQSQQATQTISFANLAFEVIVVVLLVVLLLNQMRKPKAPQLMMAQPGQAVPKSPEDDL